MMYIMESPTVCVQACPGLSRLVQACPQCLVAVHTMATGYECCFWNSDLYCPLKFHSNSVVLSPPESLQCIQDSTRNTSENLNYPALTKGMHKVGLTL